MALLTSPQTTQANRWLEKAREIAPVIAMHRDEGERERDLPAPVHDAFRASGLYDILLPRAYGGSQADLESAIVAVEEVSRQDGAAGWNLMIAAQSCLFADYLPEQGAEEIFGSGKTLVAGHFAPRGTAEPVQGGYRISGRWSFASGCRHADWLICGCVIMEDGRPRLNEEGSPVSPLLFILPVDQGTILDTWHTGGLRATGSHDYEIEDVFVPAHRSFPFSQLLTGPNPRESTAFTQPFLLNAAPSMAAVALGIARDAIDELKSLAGEKTPTGSPNKLIEKATVHERVGRAEALVGSGRTYLLHANAQLEAHPHPPEDVAALVRLASANAVHSAGDAVDLMYELGGSTAFYNSSRLDRCFRDVHVVSHHITVSQANYEATGQYYLGLGLPVVKR